MAIEKMISHIKFSLFSPEMVRKLSAEKLLVPDTYNEDGYPIDGGLVDQRLGVIDPGLRCKTCGGRMRSCPGHFGHIELVRPVIHPEFSRVIYVLLKSTCQHCHHILVKKRQRSVVKKKVKKGEVVPGAADLGIITSKEEAVKALESADEAEAPILGSVPLKDAEKVKKVAICAKCDKPQAIVSFVKPSAFYLGKKQLLPSDVRDWLADIPNEELQELGFDPVYARPEWAIITALLVPPVTVRPSITLETGDRSEDDLTHKLVDIMRINQRLEANINAGAPQLIIEDLWELLQYHVTTYFNNETANIPPARHRSGRPLKTLSQRLKGKEGRFRYNLSGKRVNFSARTVISPDPNISINEVGVPMMVAEEMTIPINVTDWNIEACKKLILSEDYPKALYVLRTDGKRAKVTEKTKQEISDNLTSGSIIERQLCDGDTVLFNRQPSLHRISIMRHKVRVMPGKSFRLNLVVTPPYNADFDGDEMNLHVPQTDEARVEAELLMSVEGQVISPRHGHAIIKPQEDFVSGAYFMTRDATEFTREQACQLLAIANITNLPEPDRGQKYSGRLLFSELLPKDLNLKIKSKLGEVIEIKNGLLLKGSLEARAYENELIEKIFHMHGDQAVRTFLDSSTRMCIFGVTLHGFSVDVSNYTIGEESVKKMEAVASKARKEVDGLVMQFKNKTLERLPGRSLRETLEEKIMAILSRARDASGQIIEKDLGMDNNAIIMAKIGARGSILNAIQMSAMVGQQAVRGKRLTRGYGSRPLLHFKKKSLGADAHGFVSSCFKIGLTPQEFFFHSMGGRESLVNTAIRTARSGYMQRRLINALQDMVVQSDRSVRDSRGVLIQYTFGGDGADPKEVGASRQALEKVGEELEPDD
ncbi:DNA-directed RNA polymerase subunit A' [Candidatus Gugararchaeum adminiculabundum]|nr:DNA-directed RNA polymerase subunit A' [Candidatus Gugararchaeum adminiculabundum]